MADISNAAILASIVVGMVSIPAASGNIDAETAVPEPVDNISSTDNVPKHESTNLSSNSFTKVVETAFSEIRTQVTSGNIQGELESPQSRLELKKNPDGVTWKIETPQGTLTVKQGSQKVVEKTETPQGTLKKTRVNGAVSTSFEGSNRAEVESVSGELRDLMQQKREEYRSNTDKMRTEQYSDGIHLDVAPETPEKAVLENQVGQSIDLEGWQIANNNPDYYELNQTLGDGQKLHIYSSDRDDINVTENEEDIYVYGSGLTWEDGSDTAKLFDSGGEQIESYSYTN